MKPIKEALADLIIECLPKGCTASPDEVAVSFEIPREEKFGDLSSHITLRLSKQIKKAPRPLGDELHRNLEAKLPASPLAGRIDRIAVEGPGFVNFYFSASELTEGVRRVHSEEAAFGRPKLAPKNILLEFVSANPTGPLTVAHGRQAALGDSLAKILKFCGHKVTKEYYNNDEGVQIETLGKSTLLRAEEIATGKTLEVPENYYRGDYLTETAKKLFAAKKDILRDPDRASIASNFAANDIMRGIEKDLADFDVSFDSFYSQKELGRSGRVEKTLELLRSKGVVYDSEGATWLRSTDYGDDKDRVLIKSDKNYTYLTPDIAYHHHKFERGFDTLINILGPDHHGYIARLKASQTALGHDAEHIHILIAQLVTLYEGDKQVRMSTRAGEFITLRQILDEVGRDAGRFFFVARKFDAHLDFDLELAKTQTPDNPVFYIQYAHARVGSIKKNAPPALLAKLWKETSSLSMLSHPAELRLMRLFAQYEDNVVAAERTLEPYRLLPYLMDLAAGFHRFYTENRVVTDDESLSSARLMLCDATQTVIRSGLSLLGVSAPEKM